jgi:hypothetical protein
MYEQTINKAALAQYHARFEMATTIFLSGRMVHSRIRLSSLQSRPGGTRMPAGRYTTKSASPRRDLKSDPARRQKRQAITARDRETVGAVRGVEVTAGGSGYAEATIIGWFGGSAVAERSRGYFQNVYREAGSRGVRTGLCV